MSCACRAKRSLARQRLPAAIAGHRGRQAAPGPARAAANRGPVPLHRWDHRRLCDRNLVVAWLVMSAADAAPTRSTADAGS